MVTPYPSAANFVLIRVQRGEIDAFLPELARRGIQVHRPTDPRLRDCLRISAGSAEATVALKQALVDLAVAL
jgi:histidinol-phosphate aminotransferase